MKRIARALSRDLRRAFDALAYAHTGEMMSRADKGRILSDGE
jgi:hypothetical protein